MKTCIVENIAMFDDICAATLSMRVAERPIVDRTSRRASSVAAGSSEAIHTSQNAFLNAPAPSPARAGSTASSAESGMSNVGTIVEPIHHGDSSTTAPISTSMSCQCPARSGSSSEPA